MKFRHMACIGAAIVVLVHGFETFSQQMVIFEERPRMADNATQAPAPAPPRSEIWDYYVRRGFTGAVVPALSTRAAVYSGIIATELATLTPACYTANCSWPIIPTLGACGECTSVPVASSCNATSHICTYSTPSGTSVGLPSNPGDQGVSRVAPSNGTHHPIDSASRAYFSVFDILTATSSTSGPVNATANECALWFCVQEYLLSVSEGQTNSSLLATWPTTQYESASSTHPARYRFVDIPGPFNVQPPSAIYAVTADAISVLRDFAAGLTSGTVFVNANVLDFSSD
ncbi:hypothetical protein GE09DRAFT_1128561 [Coniochaeta sp. 2T2.1]|nr:hypothetical protein GE09DRAFT_1128561 [Coniochaeta sp. 2T2.1]